MKKFCIAGPVKPEKHYFIPKRFNEQQVIELINDEKYFVLHAPRQSGPFVWAHTGHAQDDKEL